MANFKFICPDCKREYYKAATSNSDISLAYGKITRIDDCIYSRVCEDCSRLWDNYKKDVESDDGHKVELRERQIQAAQISKIEKDMQIAGIIQETSPLYEFEHPQQFCPPNIKLCWVSFSVTNDIRGMEGYARESLQNARDKGWNHVSAALNPHMMTPTKKQHSFGDYICFGRQVLCYKEVPLEIEEKIEHRSAGTCDVCHIGEMEYKKNCSVPDGVIFEDLIMFKCNNCGDELVTTQTIKTWRFLKKRRKHE